MEEGEREKYVRSERPTVMSHILQLSAPLRLSVCFSLELLNIHTTTKAHGHYLHDRLKRRRQTLQTFPLDSLHNHKTSRIQCTLEFSQTPNKGKLCNIHPNMSYILCLWDLQLTACGLFEHLYSEEDMIELILEIIFTPRGLQVSQSAPNQTPAIQSPGLDCCTTLLISSLPQYVLFYFFEI